MDLVALELTVFCLIIFYTGVTSRTIFIDSCKTTLTFTNHADKSLILSYDGRFLFDSFGQPCEPAVETKHVASATVNICLRLTSGYDTCSHFFKFYYIEDYINHYNYCDQIKYAAVCQKTNALFIEFQPWNTTQYTEHVTIKVYEEEYNEEGSSTVYAGVIIGCVVVGFVGAIVAVRQYFSSRNSRSQTANQPRPQLTRFDSRDESHGYQCPDNSAEPPRYTDVMAAERRANITNGARNGESLNTANECGHQNRQCIREDTLNPSTPPLSRDNIPEEPPPPPDDSIPEEPPPPPDDTIPEEPPPPPDDTIPEEPPPPYPGY